MDSTQIEALKEAIDAESEVLWRDARNVFRRCVEVIDEWYEVFSDGHRAETAEPAVRLEDGKYAALWGCEPFEFFTTTPIFDEDGVLHEA